MTRKSRVMVTYKTNYNMTYVDPDYLLATWPTAPAAVYKLMAQPCSTRIPEHIETSDIL